MPTATDIRDLTVEKKDLALALAQIMPAVCKQGASLPMLTGVRLRMTEEGLELMGTDLEVYVKRTIPAEGASDFVCVIGARYLARVLKEVTGTVRMQQAPPVPGDDRGRVQISWGRARVELVLWPSDDWPRIDTVDHGAWGEPIELSVEDIDKIRRISSFASNDDARPILTGLRFSNEWPGGVAGTDSYRLGVAALDATLPERTFLLQSRVVRFFPPRASGEGATMWVSEDGQQAKFTGGGLEVGSRLIEGEFPPIARLIPENPLPHRVTVDRMEMIQAVRNATAIQREDTAAPVRIHAGKTDADVIYTEHDVGNATTTIDVKHLEGPKGTDPPIIAFNTRYWLELLNVAQDDEVTIEMTDALKPAIVRDGEDWLLLIMPVRVS